MIETAESAAEERQVDPVPADGRIVVGVDGSDGSLIALSWAMREAGLRDASLHVVLGWGYHPSWGGAGLGSMFPMGYTATGGALGGGLGGARISAPISAPIESAQRMQSDAAAIADKVLDQVISAAVERDAGAASVTITRQAIEGHGAKVLLEEVTESDLLVVGSRGHGAFLGAMLGSVSQHVVAMAPCPVVVVPDRHSEASQ
ncbi:MAG: universal stress protein [Jatrophihabitantaceae bacterium]